MTLSIFLLAGIAFANGANDVSKPVATLAGSGIAAVSRALRWGTVWTALGGLAGLVWSSALVSTILTSFYVAEATATPSVFIAAALAPTGSVLVATWLRLPVSTTHAIVGALVGAGIMAFGIGGIAWGSALVKVLIPMLISPLVAFALTWALTRYLVSIVSWGERLTVRARAEFRVGYPAGGVLTSAGEGGVSVESLHWMTSGLLSFSRGLNDAPKLVAITLPFAALDAAGPLYVVAVVAMTAGALMAGRRVTRVLAFDVTPMTSNQGFAANLISAFLVIVASRLGMPVSTTHVSGAAVMGIGATTGGRLNRRTVEAILLAWVVTAPMSACLAAGIYFVLPVA